MLEPLGDVTVLSVEIGGETLRLVLPEASAAKLRPGDETAIVLDPGRLHIFRASDGQAMT